jgi:hypothetical protein
MNGHDPREPPLTRRAFVQATVCGGAAGLVAASEEKPPAPAFLAGSDWPMYRHDPALSAASPLRGGLAEAPRVAWSLDLGGPHVPSESVVVRDVTGDGRDEFLTLSADSVTCRDNRGRLLWKLDTFLNPTVLDILDFAGDGSGGILLTTTRAGKVDTYMVSGRTGKAAHRWRDENNFGGHTRVKHLFGRRRPLPQRAEALGVFLLAGLWSVAFFSASGCKRPCYILPAMPPLALALGCCVDAAVAAGRLRPVHWACAAAATFLVLFGAAQFLLPAYASKYSLRDQIVPHAEAGAGRLPVMSYPHGWDGVSYYLQRSDVRVFRLTQLGDLMSGLAR